MGFRLAIVISLLLLGIAIFYFKQTERWKWNKIVFVSTAIMVSFSIFGGMGIFIYNRMSVKPEIQTSFWDVNLSLSKQSVLFIKGPPIDITAEGFWIYESKIWFDENRIKNRKT